MNLLVGRVAANWTDHSVVMIVCHHNRMIATNGAKICLNSYQFNFGNNISHIIFLLSHKSTYSLVFPATYTSAIIMQDKIEKSKIEFLKTIIFEKLLFFSCFSLKFSFFQEPLYVCYYYAR